MVRLLAGIISQCRLGTVVAREKAVAASGIQQHVITILWLLIFAFVAMMLVRRTKLPYTIALVIVGLIVGATHAISTVHLSYGLVFTVLLPPLLFDTAIRLPVERLKRRWEPIAILVVPGVVASMLLVGNAINYWVGLGLTLSLLFGAIISATDPASVIALLRSMRVDERLSAILEGESLFNDGTAAVLYTSLLTALTTSQSASAGQITVDFIKMSIGGAVIGGAIGYGISIIMAHIDDHLLEITLTTIAAYGASLLAVTLDTSGVIAVISSGIVLGYYRGGTVMSATTQAAVYSFWEYAGFVVSSLLFLLVGIDVTTTGLAKNLGPVWIAIGVAVAARAIVAYLTGAVMSRSLQPIPLKWQHVLNWGGLRGALAIALALGIPAGLPGRSIVVAMTYGVVLWTLLPQGLSIGWLLNRLGLAGRAEAEEEYGRVVAQIMADRAALDELTKLETESILPRHLVDTLSDRLWFEIDELEQKRHELHEQYGEMVEGLLKRARRRMLAARHNAIRRAQEMGLISDTTTRDLQEENIRRYGERES